MENEYTEEQDSLNPEEEQDSTKPEGDEEASNPQEEDSSKEDASKLKELAENYKIRAEKAERRLKAKEEPEKNPEEKKELSQSDLIYLAKSDIHEDDIDEVLEIAKSQNKSLKEVHNLSWVKSWLNEKKEERKTAEATATGNKRSGPQTPDANRLYQEAQKGKYPDSKEEMQKLIEARFGGKLRK